MAKYLIGLTAYRRVIVEADTPEQAQDIAADECHVFDWDIEDVSIPHDALLDTPEKLEQAKRHGADQIN